MVQITAYSIRQWSNQPRQSKNKDWVWVQNQLVSTAHRIYNNTNGFHKTKTTQEEKIKISVNTVSEMTKNLDKLQTV